MKILRPMHFFLRFFNAAVVVDKYSIGGMWKALNNTIAQNKAMFAKLKSELPKVKVAIVCKFKTNKSIIRH